MEKNALIFERVSQMAARKGCTSSQLALAWVHHHGSDVCPLPGTTKIANFNQNLGALSVKLTPEEMAELVSYAAMDVVHDASVECCIHLRRSGGFRQLQPLLHRSHAWLALHNAAPLQQLGGIHALPEREFLLPLSHLDAEVVRERRDRSFENELPSLA